MTAYKYTDEYILNLSKELKEWALLDTSTAFCQFLASKNLSYANHYFFRNKSEIYQEAIESVRPYLATRLRALLENKDKLIMMELGHHDQIFHDYTESIKEADAQRSAHIESKKQSVYNIMVPHDLTVGANISTAPISNTADKGSE